MYARLVSSILFSSLTCLILISSFFQCNIPPFFSYSFISVFLLSILLPPSKVTLSLAFPCSSAPSFNFTLHLLFSHSFLLFHPLLLSISLPNHFIFFSSCSFPISKNSSPSLPTSYHHPFFSIFPLLSAPFNLALTLFHLPSFPIFINWSFFPPSFILLLSIFHLFFLFFFLFGFKSTWPVYIT